MANRSYKRNRKGQFASNGTVVTTGKAGGFASAAHRTNVANRAAAVKRRKALIKNGGRVATAATILGASAYLHKNPTGRGSQVANGLLAATTTGVFIKGVRYATGR